ncbi:MAG: hypothetical protein K0R92_2929 [Lachnospiraceae bacterium]|nr:hypothetical protein [Lachnospiraceae bacterium]
MRDIKIVFEMTNNNMNLDIKTEQPEDFVAGVAYMIVLACEKTGLSRNEITQAISNVDM